MTRSAAEADDPRGIWARAAATADPSVTDARELVVTILTSVEFTALINATERAGSGPVVGDSFRAVSPATEGLPQLATAAMLSVTANTQITLLITM